MMGSEVISQRLKKSVGKHCKIFLKNGFRFEGTITNCDDTWVEVLEPSEKYKLIKLNEVSDAEVEGE